MNRIVKLFLVISMCIMLVFTAFGCSKSETADNAFNMSEKYENTNIEIARSEQKALSVEEGSMEAEYDSKSPESNSATALTGTGESITTANNPILSERKIIRNANISVKVDNFNTAYGKINFFISGIGYVQETKINANEHYVNSEQILLTSGIIIIRVDADKFDSVLKDIKGLGTITEENIKTDDVTEKFFDIESRLRLLGYEQSRLEEILKSTTDIDAIFKTESRLTDIRHEIERLTGTLNKLKDLVNLSTITINMHEKLPESANKVPEEKSYWGKLSENFVSSLNGVIDFCGSALLAFASSIPVLALLSIIFMVCLFTYRKFFKNKKEKASTVDKDNNSSM